jgi:hypothetical protein
MAAAAAADFIGPAEYDKLEKIPGKELDSNKELEFQDLIDALPRVKIPAGTIIYRADRREAKTPSTKIPAFFGNRKTIEPYTKSDRTADVNLSKIVRYRFKTDVELIELNLNSLSMLNIIFESLSPEMFSDTDLVLLNKKAAYGHAILSTWVDEDGDVNPSLPLYKLGENGKAYLKKQSGFTVYLNRYIASLLCALEIPGWIALPYNPDKRQGIIQKSVKYGRVPYPPEMMLCKWDDLLEPVSTSGGTRRRRRRSQMRKTRKHK